MNAVHSEIRMVPVDQRIVETDFESLRTECIDHFPQQITSAFRIRNLVIGIFRIPHAEAFMMLCGNDEIFHSGFTRRLRPLLRIEEIRIEVIKVFLVILVGDFLVMSDPFVTCRHGVEPPVNEHAESVLDEPFRIAASKLAHNPVSFFNDWRRGRFCCGVLP